MTPAETPSSLSVLEFVTGTIGCEFIAALIAVVAVFTVVVAVITMVVSLFTVVDAILARSIAI